MNSGETIFAQLMDFVPAYEFRKCVERYNGNHKVISFSCWDQYLCMAFAQFPYRESLRDIRVCLWATQSRLYHLGIRKLTICDNRILTTPERCLKFEMTRVRRRTFSSRWERRCSYVTLIFSTVSDMCCTYHHRN